MAEVTVVARVAAKANCVEALKAELLKLIEPTRKEPGCLCYTLHQDNQDPTLFLFYETWEDAACLEKHMNTEHFKKYVIAVTEMVKEKVVHKMTRIA